MVRFPLADLIIHSLHKAISTHPLGPAYGGRGCCGSSFAQRLALLLTLKFASRRHDDKSNLLHQSTKTKSTISLATSPTLNVACWLPGIGGGGKDVVVVSLGRGYGCHNSCLPTLVVYYCSRVSYGTVGSQVVRTDVHDFWVECVDHRVR